jgi:hypothetical protein
MPHIQTSPRISFPNTANMSAFMMSSRGLYPVVLTDKFVHSSTSSSLCSSRLLNSFTHHPPKWKKSVSTHSPACTTMKRSEMYIGYTPKAHIPDFRILNGIARGPRPSTKDIDAHSLNPSNPSMTSRNKQFWVARLRTFQETSLSQDAKVSRSTRTDTSHERHRLQPRTWTTNHY